MKISANILADLAFQIMDQGLADGLGNVRGNVDELVKVELAVAIKRAVWTGQKRLVLDLVYPKA